MRWRRVLVVLSLITLVVWHYFNNHHPSYQVIYDRELYIYQDGSHHPLTSHLAEKIEGDYLLRLNKTVVWFWRPQDKKIIDSTNVDTRLAADPSTLNNGDVSTITWSTSQSGIKMDILALYCPSDSMSDKFIDYWHVGSFPGLSNSDKNGEVRIALYNIGVSCEFRMFSIGRDMVRLVAVSNIIDFIEAPMHIHLSLTCTPNQMRIQWTSRHLYQPIVFYGLSPTDLSHNAAGSWKTYTEKDMCGPPANETQFFVHPGYLYDVLLTDLKISTPYFYKCGGTQSKFSSIKNFTTSLIKGSPEQFRFAVYGDMDVTSHPGAETTAKLVLKDTVDNGLSFVLHIGDVSYANGFSYRWEEWMTMIEPYSSLIPYLVSIGNHDQVTAMGSSRDPSGNSTVRRPGSFHDSGGECGVPLDYRFHMPDSGNRLWWYSFDYGSVHFTQISSEHNLSHGSVQYAWLQNDLAEVDSLVTPWMIVTSHRPMYTSQKLGINEEIVGQNIRDDIEELLSS